MEPGGLRASNADRDRVAERLRQALDEGRLNLTEYDERLQNTYAAKTYSDLDALLSDLPSSTGSTVVPMDSRHGPDVWVPGPDGRYPGATRRWIAEEWGSWTGVVVLTTAIWAFSSLFSGQLEYFWPFWVAVPWGMFIAVRTVQGLGSGEPQRWAARRARKQAERELRRRARHED